jgi:hypothetical protein
MSPEQFAEISENVRYIRDRVDTHSSQIADVRVAVGRMEERAGFIGALTGVIGGLLAGIGLHLKGR